MVTPCSKLWTDISLNVNKKEVVNCTERRQIDNPSLEEISSSEFWHSRKETVDAKSHWLSNGSFPKGCEACSLHHPNGLYTVRNKWFGLEPDFSKDHTQYIEIQLGTKCNQTCMYCNAECSSLWAKKLGVPYTEPDEQWKEAALNGLYKHVEENMHDKEVVTYNFLGGETLIIDDFLDVVERFAYIHNERQQKCVMHFISNLNVGPAVVQKFIDLCQSYPQVEFDLNASIENLGERAEAVREGLNFSRLEYNLNWLASEPHISKIGCLPTMNALSISDHTNFLLWVMRTISQHRKLEDCGKTWTMGLNVIKEPKAMHPGILPEHYTSYMDNAINLISEVSIPQKETYASHLSNIRNQIGTRRNKDYLDRAYRWYKKQEKLHNRDYWKIFPELNDIFFKINAF